MWSALNKLPQNISELKIVSEMILNVLNICQFCLDIGIYFISDDDRDDSNVSQDRWSKMAGIYRWRIILADTDFFQ